MPGFIIFMILSAGCYSTIYLKKRDVLHPLGLMVSIWFMMAGVSCLQLGRYQSPWCLETVMIVFFTGIICYILAVPGKGIQNDLLETCKDPYVNKIFLILSRVIFVICLSVIVYHLYKNSFFSAGHTKMLDRKTGNAEYIQMQGRLANYISSYLPYCALNSVFELVYSPKAKRRWLYNLFVMVFSVWYIWGVSYSRGTLLIVFLGSLYIIHSKYRISLIRVILIGIILITAMAVLMRLRIGESSGVYSGATNNALFNSVYNYIVYCFQNFDSIVKNGSQHSIFLHVWQSVYKLFGLYDESMLIHYQTLFYNAETYLAPFYQDLDLIGVIIYPALIAIVLSIFYDASKQNIYYILILANFQKAIYTAFFGNYFLTTLSVMFPYILTFAICLISYRWKWKIVRK